MDPDTPGAKVPATNITSHRRHLPSLSNKSQSWESQSIIQQAAPTDWFQSSETEYHLKLAGRDLIWNIQQFLCRSEDLGNESDWESSQARLEFHELMIWNRYLYWIIQHFHPLNTLLCFAWLSIDNLHAWQTPVCIYFAKTDTRVCWLWELWALTVSRWVWGPSDQVCSTPHSAGLCCRWVTHCSHQPSATITKCQPHECGD